MTAAVRGNLTEISASAASAEKPARTLAIDYGRKRLGLALSDELGVTVRPLAVLVRRNRREDLRRLRYICRENGVTHVLVGHPLHMSGDAGEMAQEAAQFARRLQQDLRVGTELVDERLTSWEAEQQVASGSLPGHKHGAPIDSLAAAILLREYLGSKIGPSQPSPARKG